MRNTQSSSKGYLASTPPAPRIIRNTSLLTLMQEKLQPKLQPPATPENLEKCWEGWTELWTVFPLSPALSEADDASVDILWECGMSCFLAAIQFHRMWRWETKKNYSIIMSAPCRHKTAPHSPFSPCCSAEFEMAQARRFSITSLKGLFLWFNSPVATMAFISLCLTFLGFILFLSPQSSSLGCVSPTPRPTPSELAIPAESSVPWIWTLKPRTRGLLLIFLLDCLWKSWRGFSVS